MNNKSLPPVLMVGNFLSSTDGNQGVCDDLADHLRMKKQIVMTTSSKSGRLYRLADMLITILHRNSEYQVAQVDVFSGMAFLWAEASCFLLRWLGKPHILTLHGGNLPNFAHRWPRRVKRLLKSANAVITPSLYLQENMSLFRQDIFVIPNPLNLSAYKYHVPPKNAPNMVWLRAFHEIYNPSLAVSVLKRLILDYPETNLTMVGPDKGDGSLQETRNLAIKLGIMDHITWTGGVPKSDVSHWLEQGNIFLNTTYIDNTPVSVLEAMACGLCIVSTNVGGLPFLLEDGVDALLVPPNDPEAMASAVCRVFAEPGLAEKLSTNARRKAEQFDWSLVLPQWEALFLEIVNKDNYG